MGETLKRICKKCGKELPLTSAHFQTKRRLYDETIVYKRDCRDCCIGGQDGQTNQDNV